MVQTYYQDAWNKINSRLVDGKRRWRRMDKVLQTQMPHLRQKEAASEMINQTNHDSLLPCPFCGGEAVIEEVNYGEEIGGCRKSAGCNTEGCQGYQSLVTFSTYREAAEAWNKRRPRK